MHCLDLFCQASGQKINNQKTQIFFSKNVDQSVREAILHHTGYAETPNIRRYLGANLTTGRSTRSHYRHIIDKIQSKLSGWKHQCLSLAGRVTLTQSVLCSVPYFHMQYTRLPKNICDEIEKIERGFLWGDTDHSRKPHLVNWNTCCLPKKEGGLGIKRTGQMNDAFLMKLLWNLITKPQDLWCKVLISKYGRNNDLTHNMVSKPTDSPLWKALTALWDKFMKRVFWKVGNGQTINFWLDKWIPNEERSLMRIVEEEELFDTTLVLFDATNGNGNWNLHAITHHIPSDTLNKITSIPPPLRDDRPDWLGWQGTMDNEFSTKSAYLSLSVNNTSVDCNWNSIWSWKGPHRIQSFMWIVAHGRLLTNSRRHKWNTSTSPTCPLCNNEEESLLHVLRDCVFATRIWLRLVPSTHVQTFFEANENEWVFGNLAQGKINVRGLPWQSIFMVACWYLWQWRNKTIFEEGFQRPHDAVRLILQYTQDITNIEESHKVHYHTETVLIKWQLPEEGWWKLNTDGACKLDTNKAGCGGLIRDARGRWVRGFTRNLGTCSAFHAEMWGVWIGMEMAWQLNVPKLVVESDSKSLVDMIKGRGSTSTHNFTLLNRIRSLMERQWEIEVNHTWRERNSCADWLANASLLVEDINTIILEEPPEGIHQLLCDDLAGAPVPRSYRIRS